MPHNTVTVTDNFTLHIEDDGQKLKIRVMKLLKRSVRQVQCGGYTEQKEVLSIEVPK